MKEIQKDNSDGWKGLSFYKDEKGNVGWIFSSYEVFFAICEEFEPLVDDLVNNEMESVRTKQEEQEGRDEKLLAIDINDLNSDLKVDTLKPLFSFQKEAVDFVNKVGGRALIADDMGCLSGDTIIQVNRGGNCRKYRLEDAFKRFNGLEDDRKNWRLDSYIRSVNENGEFCLNKVEKILYKGVKDIVLITVKSGSKNYHIKLTADHKILMADNSWKEAGEIRVSDSVLVNGVKYSSRWGKGNSNYKGGEFKDKDGYIKVSSLQRHPYWKSQGMYKHRLVMEAFLNNRSYLDWLSLIKYGWIKNPKIKFLRPSKVIHHINGIKDDNKVDNLEVFKNSSAHAKHEGINKLYRNLKDTFIPKVAKVVAIQIAIGKEYVYDVVMASPYKNFVANSFIVHNCGKTIEAIGYTVLKNYSRVLVICPASVKTNWKREILAFSGVSANIVTETKERGGWEIIGYSNLDKFWDYIRKEPYQLIIVDEAHYIKNKKAIRSRKTIKLLKKAKDVIFLTGTPVLNRPYEIYNIFNFIRPMDFWGDNGFARRYCGLVQDSFGRWDYTGATNLDDLKEKMSFMIRRTKKEVLTELPDKTINVLETKMKSWKDYKDILSDFKKWLKDKKLNESAVFAEALTKVNYLKQVVVENKNIKSELDNLLESGKKIIVFSQYKTVINKLYDEYRDKSVKLTGDTPTNDRQGLVDKFQEDGDCKLFFSTIKAGGVGITLTEADSVVFCDLDWTPATHSQAEDRAYRIGQRNNVNVYYFITPKTIEEKIWKMLKRKEVMINKIMEGEKARKVHIKTLIKNL
jgi:SWI/SNF-related matrix-associated actin-dependent regulator 1 of chromatin subfamily A